MQFVPAVLVLWVVLLYACTVPREARLLKRGTVHWREADAVATAYLDGGMMGSVLTLRENGKFEMVHEMGGIHRFGAGNWAFRGDTLQLFYMNLRDSIVELDTLYMNRKTGRLYYHPCDSGYFGFRITLTERE